MFGKASGRGGATFSNNSSGRGRGGAFQGGGAAGAGRGGRSAFDQAFGKPAFNKNPPQTDRPTPFGQSNKTASVFGQSSQMSNNNAFGNSAFSQAIDNSQSQSVFGQSLASTTSPFGQAQATQSVFNQQPSSVSNSAFNSAFGNTGFSQPAASESPFGQRQQPEHNTAFNQAFGNTGFRSNTDHRQQPQSNSAFNQAFGNTVNNTPPPKAFNQGNTGFNQPNMSNPIPPTNTFSQPFGNTTGFNQPTDNTSKAPNAFNQAFGSTGFSTPKTVEKATPAAFNQAFGNTAFNKPKVQKKPSAAFDQAFGGSGFDQPMNTDNTPKAFTKKSHSFNQAVSGSESVDSNAPTGQPKRTLSAKSNIASRIGGNASATTKAKVTPTVAKKAVNTSQVASTFQRKPNKKTSETSSALKDSGISSAADRAARFGSTSKSVLYDQFKENRVRERQQAIAQGLIPDPDNPTRLEDAIDFRGTCQAKCPDFEMLEREIQNGLDALEMDEEGNVDPEKAVKAYRRSAAGIDQPLPSDVRSPEALVNTLDYLVDEILTNVPLEKCHAFVRDRTRSIRQDFTLQNIRDVTAVEIHERIARFHILCLHEMCELDEGKFSKQQETEQLRKVLVSLMEFYDDLREEGIETKNEAEFRAYNVISHIRDQDIARQTMTLPVHLFKSQYITRALEFRALSQRSNEIMESSSRRNKPENIEASQNFYSAFFKLIADSGTSFLLACMLETHFADVRKGALKAMNIAYMFKAGGVQAEDVRQALAYDSVKQLLEEAQLYGLVIDNSLDVPTIRFGQKHYKSKIAVFIEPLSNPSQKKSLLLVEPKKAGRTFRDIVNGINPHVTPLPNQNVFAPQSNPILPSSGTFNFNPEATPFTAKSASKSSETTASEEAERKKKEELELAKSKAAAAEAQAARERKKMEELEERKRLEQAEKEQAKRLEEERVAREKQMMEELAKQKEKEEVELKEREKALLQQQRDKQMAAMHKNVVKSQLVKRWTDELLENIISERAQISVNKAIERDRLLKKVAYPWLARARASIKKRKTEAMSRKRKWHFNMYVITHNPYIISDDTIYKAIPSHSTPDGISKRVSQCIQAEKIALENIDKTGDNENIWKTEEFPLNIYPRIRDKMMDLKHSRSLDHGVVSKPTWQLIISAPDSDSQSSLWFARKFGLEQVFLRKDGLYQAFDITIRMITLETPISCQLANETGAVIFSLPESKAEKNKAETALYWENNRMRFNSLIEGVEKYNPGIKVPFLFTYFPDSSSTESTLKKIPELLNLASCRVVSDYHILVMNPLTIAKRIVQEVNWLSNNTVINQE